MEDPIPTVEDVFGSDQGVAGMFGPAQGVEQKDNPANVAPKTTKHSVTPRTKAPDLGRRRRHTDNSTFDFVGMKTDYNVLFTDEFGNKTCRELPEYVKRGSFGPSDGGLCIGPLGLGTWRSDSLGDEVIVRPRAQPLRLGDLMTKHRGDVGLGEEP